MKSLVIVVIVIALLQGTLAINPPSCQVKTGTVCEGHDDDTYAQGNTIDEILSGLHTQFCGCTIVSGNIQIDMSGLPGLSNSSASSPSPSPNLGTSPTNLTVAEDNFNSLYHLEQISGRFLLRNIPRIADRIILPNLRLIRGNELLSGYAMVIENVDINQLILPELTEISQGNVSVNQPSDKRLCNLVRVDWSDIIDNGIIEDNSCLEPDLSELSSCITCSPVPGLRHCWSSRSQYCQQLTKVHPSCTLCPNRCHFNNETGFFSCCNPLCSAGCNGTSADKCHACRYFNNNGTCVLSCPQEFLYNRTTFQLVSNPDFRLAENGMCVVHCSANKFRFGGECVDECPVNYTVDARSQQCLPCNGTCPKECEGKGNVFLDAVGINELRGCTVIKGNITIGSMNSSNYNISILEALSSIQEIRGTLTIQQFPGTSFPYLRNLKKVGSNSSNNLISTSCNDIIISSAIIVRQNLLVTEIDFSSLEEVLGGVILVDNPSLCYIGNLTSYSTHETNCIILPQMDDDQCLEKGFSCNPQCLSNSSCWGPLNHQCIGCLNYAYMNQCVANCSVVSSQLSASDPGIFDNAENRTCEVCDPLCRGGCFGKGPHLCFGCRGFYIVAQRDDGAHFVTCVDTCPVGTYLIARTLECRLCHENCTKEVGCAGPLPYLDQENGCLDCSLVQLNQYGQQEMCINGDVCSPGYFSDLLPPDSINASDVGGLILGIEVCVPCDMTCEECTGPGSQLGSGGCQACKFAIQGSECVSDCNTNREYLDNTTRQCRPCDRSCAGGCTGPRENHCTRCAEGFFATFANDRNSFVCVSSCGPGNYASSGECQQCDVACDECLGPGPTNCTSCSQSHELNLDGEDGRLPFTCESIELNNVGSILVGSSTGAVALFLVIILILVFVMTYFKCKTKKKKVFLSNTENRVQNDYNYTMEMRRLTVQSSFKHNIPKSLIIPSCNLLLGKSIGQGEFGIVYKGYIKSMTSDVTSEAVAVKTLKGFVHKSSVNDLLKECAKMHKFEHPNVLKLSGVCLDGGPAPYIIMPFMANGCLLSYLREGRDRLVLDSGAGSESLESLKKQLMDICLQVAKGMEYLASEKVVHRDLAARNCMIDMNFTIKVADFGLSESMDTSKVYFRQDKDDIVRFPIKWLAPESMNEGIFSEKSDVWSYGITCWEIFTGGKIPYPGISPADLPLQLDTGYRLEKPLNAACSDDVYSLILDCWDYNAKNRPSFTELVGRLSSQLVVLAEYTILNLQ